MKYRNTRPYTYGTRGWLEHSRYYTRHAIAFIAADRASMPVLLFCSCIDVWKFGGVKYSKKQKRKAVVCLVTGWKVSQACFDTLQTYRDWLILDAPCSQLSADRSIAVTCQNNLGTPPRHWRDPLLYKFWSRFHLATPPLWGESCWYRPPMLYLMI